MPYGDGVVTTRKHHHLSLSSLSLKSLCLSVCACNRKFWLFLSLSESKFALTNGDSLMRFFPFYPKFPHLDTREYVYDISRIVDGLLVQ